MAQSTISATLEPMLVQDFLAAIIAHAEFQASLTSAAVKSFLIDARELLETKRAIGLPAPLLLELAAVMELRCWEMGGIQDHLAAGLPAFADARNELADRMERGPQEFADSNSVRLSQRVLQFWLSRFASNGLEVSGAGVVVHGVDEDLFVEQVANFLWEHRHCVAKFVECEK